MRGIVYVALCVGVAGSVATSFFPGENSRWVALGFGLLCVLTLVMLLRSVLLPGRVVVRGLELVKAQDFNNRLMRVNEREADRIVDMFNSMIDRLRSERLLNIERESFLQLLVDASPMGVLMLDYDGRVTMANGAFFRITSAGTESEAIGKRVDELSGDFAPRLARLRRGETEVVRRGDSRLFRCSHLSFVQNGFPRSFYLLENLTEEVMKAERKAYEKVIRTMSHEVNNTMGGVRSVLETLQSINDDDELGEVLESCVRRCGELCGFIGSYAEVVKLPEADLRMADIRGELAGLIPFLRRLVREEVELRFDAPSRPVMVDIDKVLMQQAIVNIVKNADESIDGEGWIEISLKPLRGGCCLIVSNNGEVISEDVSEQLFSPFFTTKRSGRGIGLTLTSEILSRHNARYSLRSGSDGITRFTIMLQNHGGKGE